MLKMRRNNLDKIILRKWDLSDAESFNLNGEVRGVTYSQFKGELGRAGFEKIGIAIYTQKVLFNEDGNITLIDISEIVDNSHYEAMYGEKIAELRELAQTEGREGCNKTADKYENELSSLLSKNGATENRVFEYTYIGKQNTELRIQPDGIVENYSYDRSGNLTKVHILTSQQKELYKYDGNLKEYLSCDGTRTEYIHTENSIIGKEYYKYYSTDKKETVGNKTDYIFDDNNRVIEKHCYEPKKGLFGVKYILVSSEYYDYNPNGDIVEFRETSFSKEYGNDESSTTYKYEYDQNGNWIVAYIYTENGVEKVEREIEYDK